MDDTQEKIRRNLVAISAAIVAIWFLEPTLGASASLLGIADLAEVSPWKMWVAVMCALVYVALRYRFDESTIKQIKEMLTEYRAFHSAVVKWVLAREASRFILRNRKTWFLKNPEGIERRLYEGNEPLIDNAKLISLHVTVDGHEYQKTPNKGRAGFGLIGEWDSGRKIALSGGSNCKLRDAVIVSSDCFCSLGFSTSCLLEKRC